MKVLRATDWKATARTIFSLIMSIDIENDRFDSLVITFSNQKLKLIIDSLGSGPMLS